MLEELLNILRKYIFFCFFIVFKCTANGDLGLIVGQSYNGLRVQFYGIIQEHSSVLFLRSLFPDVKLNEESVLSFPSSETIEQMTQNKTKNTQLTLSKTQKTPQSCAKKRRKSDEKFIDNVASELAYALKDVMPIINKKEDEISAGIENPKLLEEATETCSENSASSFFVIEPTEEIIKANEEIYQLIQKKLHSTK